MPISLREQNKRKCRAKILRAARRLFNARGYDETMMTDVAEKAAVSRATLYNYFPNKESLIFGIAEEEIDKLRQMVTADLRVEPDADKMIRRVMTAYILDAVSYISLARRIAFLYADEGSGRDSGGPYARMNELLHEMVAAAKEQGVFRHDVESQVIVDLLTGVYHTALFGWPNAGQYSEDECRRKVALMLDLALAGVYARQG